MRICPQCFYSYGYFTFIYIIIIIIVIILGINDDISRWVIKGGWERIEKSLGGFTALYWSLAKLPVSPALKRVTTDPKIFRGLFTGIFLITTAEVLSEETRNERLSRKQSSQKILRLFTSSKMILPRGMRCKAQFSHTRFVISLICTAIFWHIAIHKFTEALLL